MSILTEISGANEYKGDPGLGGSAAAHIEIDTKPIQDLAAYTFAYNKAEHEQKQKDADEKIKQLADLTAFDPNTALEGDKKYALQALEDLRKQGKDYASQTNASASDKVKQAWDFNQKIGAAQKRITSINGRAIAYNKRKEEILSSTLEKGQKQVKLADLEKDAKTSVDTPISGEDKFDQTIPEIKPGTLQTIEVAGIGANNNLQTKISIIDPTQMLRESQAESTGLTDLFTGDHAAFFKASGNPHAIFNDSANAYNSAVSSYKKPDGSTDYEAIKSSNPLVHDVTDLIDKYNTWAADMKAQAQSGVFMNKGIGYKTLTPIPADHFFSIDKNKPLTSDQVIFLEKFRKTSKLITTDAQLNYTGNQTKQRADTLDYNAAMAKETSQAPLVEQPLLLFEKHVATLQDKFNTPEAKGKDFIVVPYELTDETTKKVLGISTADDKVKYDTDTGKPLPTVKADPAHSFVSYKRDGTAMIGTTKQGQGGTPLTIEQQKGKFIDAVKGGNKDAALDAKFLNDAENGFRQKWGTADGQAIWNSEKSKQQAAQTTTEVYTRADYKSAGWTDAQIDTALKAGKIKVK